MIKFALVAEGILDQVVLERIIATVFKNKTTKHLVNPIQPERDATDQSKVALSCFGGWEEVIAYCAKTELLKQALVVNDYIIIHIDTDVCGHKNFNIPIILNCAPIPAKKLIADVESFLAKNLTNNFFQANRHRIIFAVAVHSTECWFLPHYGNNAATQGATSTCEARLKKELTKKNIHYEKDYDIYLELSKCFKKYTDLIIYKNKCTSLGVFTDKLVALPLTPPPKIIYRAITQPHAFVFIKILP
ncbi:hypothetical protein KW834_01840 [Pseudomonas sp. PDM29]|uniref:hypothetical protein n=1 Tax=Pseudomonas sp. PDM29 TaxID=2854771 RepID=UPI001C449810|nr:hypothetical protein [Pseudomonas sp. PDM29]MBV7523155.1 hypothetical protein [Pseudomonas sp. PDM29]